MIITSSTDPEISGEYNAVPNFFENSPTSWNISGELIPIWRANDMEDLTGKIIWVPRPQRWNWDEIAIPLQSKGAIGVVVSPHHVFRQVPGAEMFYDYRATTYKWLLPHNALSISDFTKINTSFANLNTTAFITVDSYSVNEWKVVSDSEWLVAWQVLLGFFGLVTISLGLYLLITIFRDAKKIHMTTVQLSLIFITFGAIWRTIYVVVNPFMYRRTWYTDSNDLFLTSHAVFTISPIFLIALYQHELMKRNNMAANLFLNRMRIPFFVCIGILFAAEIAISAVRSQGATTAVTYINVILYLVVALVFSIFFVVTSIRISLFLNKMRKRSTRKASLLKTTTLLACSTVAQAIFIVSLGMFLSPYFSMPLYNSIIWFFLMLSLYAISLIHIATYLINLKSILSSSKSSKVSSQLSNPSYKNNTSTNTNKDNREAEKSSPETGDSAEA
jgi:hypothetical protein